MNSIYRSIWNASSGACCAVSENVRGGGKSGSARKPGSVVGAGFCLKTLAVALALALGGTAHALPPAGVVVAGNASIAATPGNMVIQQASQNAVINWQSFNIAAGESVRFVQPNSGAVVLNRVTGADPSSILGSLSANGKVFLVNPNGVLFGQRASVNVGALVASTLNIGDADFMAGNYQFAGAGQGAVVNLGALNADGGYVALLGGTVNNQGAISARRGTVALAAGEAMTLEVLGGQLLNVTVGVGALQALAQNGGLIQAAGGQVLLTAKAADGLLASVVNNSGVIRAQTLENRNGVIRLLGDVTTVSGTLDASGRAARQSGGAVSVLGGQVALLDHALIDVAGDAGGGTALVGGDFHGAGTQRNASATTVAGGARIDADALTRGDGGRIAVWSDGETVFNGSLSARGGAVGGDGGFIETSGRHLSRGTASQVDTLAPRGATGTWLLDPLNYTIGGAGGDESAAQVTQSLATTNRIVDATNDITLADALTWTTAQTLTLQAGHDISINAAVTSSTLGAKLVLKAGHDVQVNAAVTANGGASARMEAGNDVAINGAVSVDGGMVTLIADADGTGPGVAGGTVRFGAGGGVSAPTTTILFNPDGYNNTSSEIAAYSSKVTGALDARALVFAKGSDKIYDGNTGAQLSFKGVPNDGGVVTLLPGTAAFANKNVGIGKGILYSGYELGGADSIKFSLFGDGAGTTLASITRLAIIGNVTAANKVYSGTTAAVLTSRTLTGAIAGDNLSYTGGNATFSSKNAGNGKTVSATGLVLGGADAGNYTVNSSAVTQANITPAPLTVTASNATKVYGQTPALTAYTTTPLKNGETIGSVSESSVGALATANVAGPYAIIPSNASGGSFNPANYQITYVNGLLTVTPAPLTIKASDASKVYGQTPTLTAFTSTQLQNGESIGSVTETSPGTLANADVPGPYPITPSNATGGTFNPGNYNINYINGLLVVTRAALTVTASNVSKAYGATPLLTAFTTTALQNGETVGSVIATSAGAVASAAAPGPYAIVVSGASGGTFKPSNYAITYVNGALTVVAAPVVVPPVIDPPVIDPPVVVPPVIVPPVVVPPVIVPPVVVPPVVVPPVVVPPVVVPPVIVPPVVVPPVIDPPVVVPPVTVPPVVVPPVVVPPVVVPPVINPPVVTPPVNVPQVSLPPVPVPPGAVPPEPEPTVMVPPLALFVTPPALPAPTPLPPLTARTPPPDTVFVAPPVAPVPVTPPAYAAPHHPVKQDRN